MPPTLLPTIPPLPVPHCKQTQLADCLAACASMLIEHTGRSINYGQLLELLRIGPLGTLRRYILHLTRLNFQVAYHEATCRC